MQQNQYDDPVLRQLQPDAAFGWWLRERRRLARFPCPAPGPPRQTLLDLGCGFGWHCRYARGRELDGSWEWIFRRRCWRGRSGYRGPSDRVSASGHRRTRIPAGQFDVVMSSLALHYVGRFDIVCRNVLVGSRRRVPSFFSVEHPVFTAIAAQQWCLGPAGERSHWPIDDYREGARHTKWMADDVIKSHRRLLPT